MPIQNQDLVDSAAYAVLTAAAFDGRTKITASEVRNHIRTAEKVVLHVTVVNACLLDCALVRPTGVQYEFIANT